MNEHIQTVCTKAIRMSNAYRCLLPNVNGPTFLKRLLIIHAIMSVIFYGVTTWASAISVKKNVNIIRKTLRPLKRSLCCSYRTVSDFSLDVLSGIQPANLLVKKKKLMTLYKDRKDQIEEEINEEWKEIWNKNNSDRWLKTLIKNFDEWIYRKHGNVDFYITQFMTGHGNFQRYLYKTKNCESPYCISCTDRIEDSVEHTFFECSHFVKERLELEALMNQPLNKDTIVKLMLESKQNWNMVRRYIKRILDIKKWVQNRQHTIPRADDMPPGNSGNNHQTN